MPIIIKRSSSDILACQENTQLMITVTLPIRFCKMHNYMSHLASYNIEKFTFRQYQYINKINMVQLATIQQVIVWL